MKRVFFPVTVLWLAIGLISCQTNSKTVNRQNNFEKPPTPTATIRTEIASSEIGVKFYISAYKERTFLRITFSEPAKVSPVRIEANGREITERKETDGWIEYFASFPGFEKTYRLMTVADGRQFKFETTVEPIDFEDAEPLAFHRGADNELKLSRPYTANRELWVSGRGENGAFKGLAEFNETKDAMIIPVSMAKQLGVGEAKIALYDEEIKTVDNESFAALLDVTYISEIKLKVVN